MWRRSWRRGARRPARLVEQRPDPLRVVQLAELVDEHVARVAPQGAGGLLLASLPSPVLLQCPQPDGIG